MDRFLSSTINKVDKKGRVSIPANFRPALGDTNRLYTLMSVDRPSVDAGGVELIERGEAYLEKLDPFSEEYELYSFVLHGDSDQLKVDAEGRVILSEAILSQTGITDRAAFVGRGHFFQIWQPDQLEAYRQNARSQVALMRKSMGKNSGGGSSIEGGANG